VYYAILVKSDLPRQDRLSAGLHINITLCTVYKL